MANQPMGTAVHTTEIPYFGAKIMATATRIPRFTRLAMVNMVMSPAPRSRPSVLVLNQIRQKKTLIKRRYPMPVSMAVRVPSSPRKAEMIWSVNRFSVTAISTAKAMTSFTAA